MADTTTEKDPREGYNARICTDRQVKDLEGIADSLKRNTEETGSFRERLMDIAKSFAINEDMSLQRAESSIREVFEATHGQTLYAYQQNMLTKEKELFDREKNPATKEKERAYQGVNAAAKGVKEGNMISPNRAFATEATKVAGELGITDRGAAKLMAEAFNEEKDRELKEFKKELKEEHFDPQVEAEKAIRKQKQSQTRGRQPTQA